MRVRLSVKMTKLEALPEQMAEAAKLACQDIAKDVAAKASQDSPMRSGALRASYYFVTFDTTDYEARLSEARGLYESFYGRGLDRIRRAVRPKKETEVVVASTQPYAVYVAAPILAEAAEAYRDKMAVYYTRRLREILGR